MNQKPQFVPGDPLATLRNCRGYYECPKDPGGRRLGPLVGYAGEYEPDKHWVGDIYLNAAKLEVHPSILQQMVDELSAQLDGQVDWVMGVPEGGRSPGLLLALRLGVDFIYPDRKTIQVATGGQRGKDRLLMGRHDVPLHTRGYIMEDVINNFSSTTEVIDLVEENESEVAAIACLFNRSSREVFEHGRPFPVISLANVPTAQYRQDDPVVADDVAAGNIIWKPKIEWLRLEEAMLAHQASG